MYHWGRAPLRRSLLLATVGVRRNRLQRLERQLEARLGAVRSQLATLERARLTGPGMRERRPPYSTVGAFTAARAPGVPAAEEAADEREAAEQREAAEEREERQQREERQPPRRERPTQRRPSQRPDTGQSRSRR